MWARKCYPFNGQRRIDWDGFDFIISFFFVVRYSFAQKLIASVLPNLRKKIRSHWYVDNVSCIWKWILLKLSAYLLLSINFTAFILRWKFILSHLYSFSGNTHKIINRIVFFRVYVGIFSLFSMYFEIKITFITIN